jgi:hypothetical protein
MLSAHAQTNRAALPPMIRLSATGGGPGGGWNAYIEFRPTRRGFSVWANPPDPNDWSGRETRMRKMAASNARLTWRAAAEWLLASDDTQANRVFINPMTIDYDGVADWQGDLLSLCWVGPEVDEAFPQERDWLLVQEDEDLEELHEGLGSLRSIDALQRVREITQDDPGEQWDDATRLRVLLEQADAPRD